MEQVNRVTQSLIDNLQKHQRSLAVYVDFTKAYDKVWRDNLWAKMGNTGIPTCVTRWVKSLLSDRYACVNFNDTRSHKRRFDNGLPQGSVLAPLLWLIYINDLPDKLNNPDTHLGTSKSLFADDLAIITTGKTLYECEKAMKPVLKQLEQWAKENKMTISICDSPESKTVCCLYTKDNTENNGKVKPKIQLNGITIHHNITPKFLGVIVDQQLTFKAHAEYVVGKSGKRNRILRCLSGRTWGQKSDQLRSLHITYTQSAMDYGLGSWGPMLATSNMEKVAVKEREAARIITGCTRDTPKEALMCEAGLTPVSYRSSLQATLQYERNMRLPDDIPAKIVSRQYVKPRLKKRSKKDEIAGDKLLPPRETAQMTLARAKLDCIPKEKTVIYPTLNPWEWEAERVTFNTSLDGCMGKNDHITNIQNAAEKLYDSFQEHDIVCFTDGSVVEGKDCGGSGATIKIPELEDKITVKRACGTICSSYRAEMMAIEEALTIITKHIEESEIEFDRTVWVVADSLSSITTLKQGPGNQLSSI